MESKRPDAAAEGSLPDPHQTDPPADLFPTSAEAAAAAGRPIDDPVAPPGYKILGKLGRGGMGIVLRACQVRLNRDVALKMMRAGDQASYEECVRFIAEGETAALLNHPGVVQVYDLGNHAGQLYMALEYCSGGSLSKRLNGEPMPPRKAAELAHRLAESIGFAHARAIVHRDLKPANILLAGSRIEDRGSSKGKVIEATAAPRSSILNPQSSILDPKISDFGVAKRLEAGAGMTKSGVALGTPSYMAPEQATASKRVTPAADVYSLGAILYEMLTGQPPFKAATHLETMKLVLTAEPAPVRQRQPDVPRDLEAVCMKCLRKDPRQRYPDGAALAADLEKFLRGEPVEARPRGPVVQFLRRHRYAAISGILLIAAVVGLVVPTIWKAREFRTAKQLVEQLIRTHPEMKNKPRAEIVKQLSDSHPDLSPDEIDSLLKTIEGGKAKN